MGLYLKVRDTVTGGSVLASGAQPPASVTICSTLLFAWNSCSGSLFQPLITVPVTVYTYTGVPGESLASLEVQRLFSITDRQTDRRGDVWRHHTA
jgi:hypothetical protein